MGSSLVSFEMIFEALPFEPIRFKFQTLRNPKNPRAQPRNIFRGGTLECNIMNLKTR